MENDCPECYGRPPQEESASCAACEYHESCLVYASMREEPAHARSHTCGEKALELEENIQKVQACESRTTVTVAELAEFAKLLFRIDDYTLLLLRGIIADGAASVKALADALGVRRQSVYAKIVNVMKEFPELATVFAALMPRISIAKRRYLKNQTRKTKNGKEKVK